MTSQTRIEDGPRVHQRKGVRNRRLPAMRLHVSLPGTVTALTTGPLRGFLTGRDALIMRVLVKI